MDVSCLLVIFINFKRLNLCTSTKLLFLPKIAFAHMAIMVSLLQEVQHNFKPERRHL